MGEKIGQPVTTETGQPRIPKVIPVTEPAEPPAEVPEEEPVKEPEKEPVKADAELTDEELESAIRRSAKFLGVSEDEVRSMIVNVADRIAEVLDRTPREK